MYLYLTNVKRDGLLVNVRIDRVKIEWMVPKMLNCEISSFIKVGIF